MTKQMYFNGIFAIAALLAATTPAIGGEPSADRATSTVVQNVDQNLEQHFQTPPDASKPWAYWWWLNGNVTEKSLTRDLEEMKKKGIGGVLMFDARGYHDDLTPPPPVKIEYLSPEWLRMLRHALSEARRLGITVSINLSSSAGAVGGTWPVGNDAPKKLVQTTAEVVGPQKISLSLPCPAEKPLWNIGVVAARHLDDAAAANSKNSTAAKKSSAKKQPVVAEAIDLSDKVDANGQLQWDVPAGKWTVFRFGYVLMSGHENDVDVLNAAAVEGHFRRMGGVMMEQAGPKEGSPLKYFYSVSWEGAVPTWTIDFDKEFLRRRGYDIRPWLPVLTKMTVKSPELSQRFLRDYYRTLGDLFADNCYEKLRDLCHQNGLLWHSESGGPWERKIPNFAHADQFVFLAQNDMPQGEFWSPRDQQALAVPPAIASHTFGTQLAAVEAFTAMGPHWSEYPAMLKPLADHVFCDGANQFVWHTFSDSPESFGKPGIEYFAGTHFNPNVTWWNQTGPFLTYLARCQHMLRQGRFVADVCGYVGDNPYLHWGHGEKWSDHPTLKPCKGFAYDIFGDEVLLKKATVRDGRIVLPDGMSYSLLVVDPETATVSPKALQKVIDLASAGATVLLGHRIPQAAPGLQNYPAADGEVAHLAKQLWGESNAAGVRRLGKGTVITGMTLDEAIKSQKLTPDFAGPCNYIHRRDAATDIYFIAGKQGRAECTFRVSGKTPEIWDAVQGTFRDAPCYREAAGVTTIPIDLPDNGSLFVVFRRPAAKHWTSIAGPANGLEITGTNDRGMTAHVWRQGQYLLTDNDGQTKTLAIDALPKPVSLEGPWQVVFAHGWGAPDSVVFEQLIPWNKHATPGIKYFSGTAVYHKTFKLTAAQAASPIRLQLGNVQNIAEVRLNGKSLGVVWTAPWTVDLLGVAKAGENQLEIAVTNTWRNRLIGDAGLPESERLTKTNVRRNPNDKFKEPWMGVIRGYLPTDALAPSGLLGPVAIEFGRVEKL